MSKSKITHFIKNVNTERQVISVKKTNKKEERLLYFAKKTCSRTPMPRPAIFDDRTKFNRARNKQRILRYD